MDVPALNAFVRSHILTGQCREIDKGVEVVVEQSPLTCVKGSHSSIREVCLCVGGGDGLVLAQNH
jgi:hypothetical protein